MVGIEEIFDWHDIDDRHVDVGNNELSRTDRSFDVVILQASGKAMGLRVNELLGSQDMVIKSLSDNFVNIRGLSGASILGDGSVSLMLDVGTMFHMAIQSSFRANRVGMNPLNDSGEKMLDADQLASLQASLHEGSRNATLALSDWIGKESVVEIDSVEQLPLEEATALLPAGDQPICFCSMELAGTLAGEMILVFDDASGLALVDMLTDQPKGTTTRWTDMATSAALETTNILCCAYLNALSQSLSSSNESRGLVPAAPKFNRDFGASLMQFALMGQAVAFDQVIVAKTRFTVEGSLVNWMLLFVPDGESMQRLPELMTRRR